ncbi:MAG: lipoyl-dependent peroxiredoxin [Solirubrobacteraceae bacterium]|nr:lipoyl-dependent peroxiredoxin [Solirubrobacteraceae bacterium]
MVGHALPQCSAAHRWRIFEWMRTLYTASATADDEGRNGRTRAADGSLDLALSMPEAMGGPGGDGTNPEQLFALGYAACFANAMRSVARREERLDVVKGSTVTAHVDIGAIGGGRFGLAVRLDVAVPELGQSDAEDVVAKAHDRCPYSNATRGNIPVEIAVQGGAA